jgi:hypothetical protein
VRTQFFRGACHYKPEGKKDGGLLSPT